jgi:hypothetical protein
MLTVRSLNAPLVNGACKLTEHLSCVRHEGVHSVANDNKQYLTSPVQVLCKVYPAEVAPMECSVVSALVIERDVMTHDDGSVRRLTQKSETAAQIDKLITQLNEVPFTCYNKPQCLE